MKGIRWSIGDGKSVRFCWDRWLHGAEPLIHTAIGVVPEEQLNWTLDQFTTETVQWNWNVFMHLVPATVLMKVAAIMPSRVDTGPDVPYWGFSEDGRFTTRSAYRSLTLDEDISNRGLWKVIWHWSGPQRIRQFMWLAVKGALLTNWQRWHRHLADSPVCVLCGGVAESTLHALHDCPKASCMWTRIVPSENVLVFFNLPLEKWIWKNLTNAIGINREQWEVLFGVTIWQVWSQRNAFTFSNEQCNASRMLKNMERHVNSISATLWGARSIGGVGMGRENVWIRWTAPPVDWIKGLHLAWEMGFRRVLMEIDSQCAVKLVSSNAEAVGIHRNLLKAIKELLNRSWEVRVSHEYREANFVADYLATFAASGPGGLVHLADPLSGAIPWINMTF
ncbi:OLC1v1001337C1 [Oldenlandia corymbosa var. corymbosa]|uniref:OLC1v1001337C1 n=1 Tax=Oldenlandia corymbosa var. corymbosa TaxID=529605 RepID=A0AAV1D4X2_OLDCO|nr:OLC1v1001337C1 [Oldenlandia corymbosa var. corymbosa]